jgi:glycosyl transferase family 25
MKVVVINLDRSTDRIQWMDYQLRYFNIPYSRFSAVDGKKLYNINEKASMKCTKLLCNHGIIGCALSHIQVLKNFLESEDEFMCVMEDDIIIHEQLAPFLKQVGNIYNELEFDTINLACVGLFCGGSVVDVGEYKFSKSIFPLGMGCYIISRKGATNIIENMGDKVDYHIDFEIALRGVDCYVVNSHKLVSVNDEMATTIGSRSTSILLSLLDACGFHNVCWILRVPVFTINLSYSVSIYHSILLLILGTAIFYKNHWLIAISLVELVLLSIPPKKP